MGLAEKLRNSRYMTLIPEYLRSDEDFLVFFSLLVHEFDISFENIRTFTDLINPDKVPMKFIEALGSYFNYTYLPNAKDDFNREAVTRMRSIWEQRGTTHSIIMAGSHGWNEGYVGGDLFIPEYSISKEQARLTIPRLQIFRHDVSHFSGNHVFMKWGYNTDGILWLEVPYFDDDVRQRVFGVTPAGLKYIFLTNFEFPANPDTDVGKFNELSYFARMKVWPKFQSEKDSGNANLDLFIDTVLRYIPDPLFDILIHSEKRGRPLHSGRRMLIIEKEINMQTGASMLPLGHLQLPFGKMSFVDVEVPIVKGAFVHNQSAFSSEDKYSMSTWYKEDLDLLKQMEGVIFKDTLHHNVSDFSGTDLYSTVRLYQKRKELYDFNSYIKSLTGEYLDLTSRDIADHVMRSLEYYFNLINELNIDYCIYASRSEDAGIYNLLKFKDFGVFGDYLDYIFDIDLTYLSDPFLSTIFHNKTEFGNRRRYFSGGLEVGIGEDFDIGMGASVISLSDLKRPLRRVGDEGVSLEVIKGEMVESKSAFSSLDKYAHKRLIWPANPDEMERYNRGDESVHGFLHDSNKYIVSHSGEYLDLEGKKTAEGIIHKVLDVDTTHLLSMVKAKQTLYGEGEYQGLFDSVKYVDADLYRKLNDSGVDLDYAIEWLLKFYEDGFTHDRSSFSGKDKIGGIFPRIWSWFAKDIDLGVSMLSVIDLSSKFDDRYTRDSDYKIASTGEYIDLWNTITAKNITHDPSLSKEANVLSIRKIRSSIYGDSDYFNAVRVNVDPRAYVHSMIKHRVVLSMVTMLGLGDIKCLGLDRFLKIRSVLVGDGLNDSVKAYGENHQLTSERKVISILYGNGEVFHTVDMEIPDDHIYFSDMKFDSDIQAIYEMGGVFEEFLRDLYHSVSMLQMPFLTDDNAGKLGKRSGTCEYLDSVDADRADHVNRNIDLEYAEVVKETKILVNFDADDLAHVSAEVSVPRKYRVDLGYVDQSLWGEPKFYSLVKCRVDLGIIDQSHFEVTSEKIDNLYSGVSMLPIPQLIDDNAGKLGKRSGTGEYLDSVDADSGYTYHLRRDIDISHGGFDYPEEAKDLADTVLLLSGLKEMWPDDCLYDVTDVQFLTPYDLRDAFAEVDFEILDVA